VDRVNLKVGEGEIVSVVGESGCGKSTLGNSILGLVNITSGSLFLDGQPVAFQKRDAWKAFRKNFQIIFQDPYSSLNPRHTVFEIIAEPLLFHKICTKPQVREKVAELLNKVGLSADYMNRFPHEFSGGQRQRLGIARVIAVRPKLIICDEIVSALDVSVQAQIIQLLLDLKKEMNLSLLFIAHDLALVKAVSDKIFVMYMGKIVETANTKTLFAHPRHPYTKALLDSIPTLNREIRPKPLKGEIPTASDLPAGCAFYGRCGYAKPDCKKNEPRLETVGEGKAACFYPIASA